MAAADKVCEYSDDYEGYEMYKCKQNHIQVLSKYRKNFRGHKATLYIFEHELQVVDPNGYTRRAELSSINPNPTEEDWNSGKSSRVLIPTKWGKPELWNVFYSSMQEYKDTIKQQFRSRLLMEYSYVLHVPSVPGKVNGVYTNYSNDITTVKRKLKRLVGSKNLTIKFIKNDTMCDFLSELYPVLKD